MPGHPFFQQFANRPAIMPVIHVVSHEQSLTSAGVAFRCGADGIWLIDHRGRGATFLNDCYDVIRANHPSMWIGLNYLGIHPEKAFPLLPAGLNGYWSDNFGVTKPVTNHAALLASGAVDVHVTSPFKNNLHFAGVAFKYQDEVPNHQVGPVAKFASEILGTTGVITTSGTATGNAPDLEKIRLMRDSLAEYPLAVASGISPKNVGEFAPLIDAILVASSVTNEREILDPSRLDALIKAARR